MQKCWNSNICLSTVSYMPASHLLFWLEAAHSLPRLPPRIILNAAKYWGNKEILPVSPQSSATPCPYQAAVDAAQWAATGRKTGRAHKGPGKDLYRISPESRLCVTSVTTLLIQGMVSMILWQTWVYLHAVKRCIVEVKVRGVLILFQNELEPTTGDFNSKGQKAGCNATIAFLGETLGFCKAPIESILTVKGRL